MTGPHFQATFGISSGNFIEGLTIFSFVAKWSSLQARSMKLRQEQAAVDETKGRIDRDVYAIQWLVDSINESNKTHLRTGNSWPIRKRVCQLDTKEPPVSEGTTYAYAYARMGRNCEAPCMLYQ
jgi:hypothetical protein